MGIMNIDESDLLAAGYRKHKNNPAFNRADWMFQKRIRSPRGDTLYFINIFQYIGLYKDYGNQDGWQPEVQYYLDADQRRFMNITLGGFETIGEVEAFTAKVFDRLECSPDEPAYSPSVL